jgi:antitoxin ChpS
MELSIRKLGNSAGIILPSALLRALNLSVGSTVNAEQVKGKLVLTPAAATKPRYTLSELMAQCDPNAPVPEDMKAWDLMAPVGKEVA